jgi:membrane dipeptidase
LILSYSPPDDLKDVSEFPNLFAALFEEGWSETDLAKLAGGNFLRVFADVEKVRQLF